MTACSLHGDNASIFAILPASQGLFYAASYQDLVLELMTDEISKATHEKARLLRLKNSLLKEDIPMDKCKLQVDPEKNLLMALAFPDIYTEALALVTGKAVKFELWSNDAASLAPLEHYFFDNQQGIAIFTRVALDPTVSDEHDEFADVNVILKSNKILQHIGYTIDLTTFELEKLNPALEKLQVPGSMKETFKQDSSDRSDSSNSSNSPYTANHQQWKEKPHADPLDGGQVFVDLYDWFCTCDAFEDANTRSKLARSRQACGGLEATNVLPSILRHLPYEHPKVLPMCKHILAVAITILNWRVCKQFELFAVS